jgi:hypothetical protein
MKMCRILGIVGLLSAIPALGHAAVSASAETAVVMSALLGKVTSQPAMAEQTERTRREAAVALRAPQPRPLQGRYWRLHWHTRRICNPLRHKSLQRARTGR